jgi:hypothetical protein
MGLVLLLFHPITYAAVLAGIVALITRRQWPPLPVLLTWAVVPLLLNPILWYLGLPLFGWIFEGLGILLLFYLILPLNGILFGLGIAPSLWRWFAKYSARKAAYIGLGVQIVILIVNLIILAQFPTYAGIAGFRPAWAR